MSRARSNRPQSRRAGLRRGASLLAGGRARRALVLGVTALLGSAVSAEATTGADALNKPPIFKVGKAEAKPFLGGYSLSQHGTGLISSSLRTAYNTEGYLMGTISVTRYSGGKPATFVAALYEYRRRGANMVTDLWTPDLGSDRLGLLTLHRSGAALTGTLRVGNQPYSVSYRTVSSSAAENAVSNAATGSITSQPLTENAGVFSTAVVLADSIRGT